MVGGLETYVCDGRQGAVEVEEQGLEPHAGDALEDTPGASLVLGPRHQLHQSIHLDQIHAPVRERRRLVGPALTISAATQQPSIHSTIRKLVGRAMCFEAMCGLHLAVEMGAPAGSLQLRRGMINKFS